MFRNLACLLLSLFSVAISIEYTAAESGGTALRGTVQLSVSGKPRELPPTAVTLEQLQPEPHPPSTPKQHLMVMEGKVFHPEALIIQPGDSVVFENRDTFRHNVFSLSPGNSFDLGTYGAGKKPVATFHNPGIVKIYCNRHAEMKAYVMVSSAKYRATLGANNTFSFTDIKPGRYRLNAWNVFGDKTEELIVEPGADRTVDVAITSTVADELNPYQHLNKFGKPYPDKDSLPDDVY